MKALNAILITDNTTKFLCFEINKMKNKLPKSNLQQISFSIYYKTFKF